MFRFLLELGALGSMGYAGWVLAGGAAAGTIVAIALPTVAAAVWGTFRVDGDPRHAPVPVRGAVRLLLEAAFFGGAVALLAASSAVAAAVVFGTLVAIHYALAHRRVRWLWTHPGRDHGSDHGSRAGHSR